MSAAATTPLLALPHGEQIDWRDPSLWPDLDTLVTEDNTPVDNPYSEKQMRLLTESLYTSWQGPGEGRSFRVLANVGLFNRGRNPCLVPDVMLGLDVRSPEDLMFKEHRAWYVWIVGKAPNLSLEVVSNTKGGEDTTKLVDYAEIGIPYYVIHDPKNLLGQGKLRAFALREGKYESIESRWLPNIGLGLTLWHGVFEDSEDEWLRWCDKSGLVLPTGLELANQAGAARAAAEQRAAEEQQARAAAEQRAAEEQQARAAAEQRAAEEQLARAAAEQRAKRLAEKLRELGVDAGD